MQFGFFHPGEELIEINGLQFAVAGIFRQVSATLNGSMQS
jgi:hypothetical protein